MQPTRILALAVLLAAGSAGALPAVDPDLERAIAAIPAIHERVMGTEDAKEGIRSFVERREARFTGR